MIQLPQYRPGERDMEAPPGFQPELDPQRQTQRNNGGPLGLGQPAKSLRTAIAPQGRPVPAAAPQGPPQGSGDPRALYPSSPVVDAASDIWANRNSRQPHELIQQAFAAFLNRPAQPAEVEQLLTQASTVDELVQTLLSFRAPAPSMQSAILGR